MVTLLWQREAAETDTNLVLSSTALSIHFVQTAATRVLLGLAGRTAQRRERLLALPFRIRQVELLLLSALQYSAITGKAGRNLIFNLRPPWNGRPRRYRDSVIRRQSMTRSSPSHPSLSDSRELLALKLQSPLSSVYCMPRFTHHMTNNFLLHFEIYKLTITLFDVLICILNCYYSFRNSHKFYKAQIKRNSQKLIKADSLSPTSDFQQYFILNVSHFRCCF